MNMNFCRDLERREEATKSGFHLKRVEDLVTLLYDLAWRI
jgi:hypothetical protein